MWANGPTPRKELSIRDPRNLTTRRCGPGIEMDGEPGHSLSIPNLSHKLTMLLCLTRPMRSSDLAQLDLRFCRYRSVFPTKRSCKARQTRRTEFFFPKFDQKPIICPVRAYERLQAWPGRPTVSKDSFWP